MERPVKIGNRTSCLACGAALSAPVFVSDHFPASAQNIPTASELDGDSGIELCLRRCPVCGLHQFDCEPVDYYKKVIRAVGLSPTMRELRRKDFAHLINTYGLSGAHFIECGCGNGDFLEVLTEFPVRITGMEADETLAAAAQTKLKAAGSKGFLPGPEVFCLFTEKPDQRIPGAPFDCFLSFNFLEHQPDPLTMLKCMHHNLREGGYGLITVPSFEYILKQARYYELIRDHIANYDLPSLISLCQRAGFTVLEQGSIGIGDTLRVVVQKNSPAAPAQDTRSLAECCVDSARPLTESFSNINLHVDELILQLKKEDRKLALWGAGHQGFTVASTTALGSFAEYIIDSANFKQGRFAPASHLPIVSPEHYLTAPVDVILVAAPGYVKEITENIRSLYKEKAPEIRSI